MFKNIVLATDGSEAADRCLPYAKALAAESDGATIVVVHAKELMVGRAAGYPVHPNEDELAAKIEQQVDELAAEGLGASLRLVTGSGSHAAHTIAEVAREIGADVIVVGTRGHGSIVGLLLGSVTQRLLQIAPCPVLAVPTAR